MKTPTPTPTPTPTSTPDPTPTPLGLIIGADSLLGPRSGIGRMTLEITQAVRHRPEIASLRLLMAGHLHTPEHVLARLEGPAPLPPLAAPAAKPLLQRVKYLLRDVPGVQRLRHAKRRFAQRHQVNELAAAAQGRVLYHEPNMIPQPFAGPTVVTVNDLSWHHHPEYHPKDRLDWIDRNLRRAFHSATRFVAISHFTAQALGREFGIPESLIDVVPLAASPHFSPMSLEAAAPALARHHLTDGAYILSVSTLEPRKNFDRLMAAHLALPQKLRQRFPLVIIGGSGWGTTLANPEADRARQEGTLRLLGHVVDADLIAICARAAVFAYVSIYEGFGLPVIEAMAAGTPVLCSSTTATGETAGLAATLVDPLDVQAIAAGLESLLEDPAQAQSLRQAGLAHAHPYTWDNTATALITSWRTALGLPTAA